MIVNCVFFPVICGDNEFYCQVREECLPMEVICNGVLDCYSEDEIFDTDESNCDGQ